MKTIQIPSIRELQTCLTGLKTEIDDNNIAEDDENPSIDLTLACDKNGYALQTGDNSYTGCAYGYSFWGVSSLYRNSNCTELAKDLIEQCLELAAS